MPLTILLLHKYACMHGEWGIQDLHVVVVFLMTTVLNYTLSITGVHKRKPLSLSNPGAKSVMMSIMFEGHDHLDCATVPCNRIPNYLCAQMIC